MKTTTLLIVLASLVPLAACSGVDLAADEGQQDPHFGEAPNHNIAVQIANPRAPVTNEPLTMNGERAALAEVRYVTGKVIEPTDIAIGVVGGGESGSSGQSGGASSH